MHQQYVRTLDFNEYKYRSDVHLGRIEALLGSFFEDRGRGARHAILDFLVEYYSFRKSKLSLYTPGVGVLVTHSSPDRLDGNFWHVGQNVSRVSTDKLTTKKLTGLRWILNLLKSIDSRPPTFHCYGMHEWAMVYRTTTIRHPYLNLRLPHADIDRFVASHPIGCSHVDAFRFFTDEARPLNRFQPSRETQAEMDQPGCLHVTMDLYKWAYKAWPWIPSEILADALELAIDTRILDMQASPYDVSKYGYMPVAIETVDGRMEYATRQEELSHRAEPIRKRLIAAYELLFDQCHLVGDHNASRLKSIQV
jgi:hypothetical protein